MRNKMADPSHFKMSRPSNYPAHLAHAIAAQTHCDTQAMARAKPPHTKVPKMTLKNGILDF